MASRFWNFVSNLVAGATARAEQVNAKFQEIDGALLLVANEMNRSMRFTAGSVPAESKFQIGQTDAQRANLVLGFDAAGNVQMRSFTFTWRGDWVQPTSYAANDAVRAPESHSRSLYIALAAHTSSDFASDLAAGRWGIMVDLTQVERSVKKFKVITNAESPYSALPGDDLFVDTTAGAVTVTLPLNPLLSDQPIHICHVAGNASSNPITIERNGKLIMGLAEDMQVMTTNASFELAFCNDARGWRLVKGT